MDSRALRPASEDAVREDQDALESFGSMRYEVKKKSFRNCGPRAHHDRCGESHRRASTIKTDSPDRCVGIYARNSWKLSIGSDHEMGDRYLRNSTDYGGI